MLPDHDVSGPQYVVAVLVGAVAVPAGCFVVKPEIKKKNSLIFVKPEIYF